MISVKNLDWYRFIFLKNKFVLIIILRNDVRIENCYNLKIMYSQRNSRLSSRVSIKIILHDGKKLMDLYDKLSAGILSFDENQNLMFLIYCHISTWSGTHNLLIKELL